MQLLVHGPSPRPAPSPPTPSMPRSAHAAGARLWPGAPPMKAAPAKRCGRLRPPFPICEPAQRKWAANARAATSRAQTHSAPARPLTPLLPPAGPRSARRLGWMPWRGWPASCWRCTAPSSRSSASWSPGPAARRSCPRTVGGSLRGGRRCWQPAAGRGVPVAACCGPRRACGCACACSEPRHAAVAGLARPSSPPTPPLLCSKAHRACSPPARSPARMSHTTLRTHPTAPLPPSCRGAAAAPAGGAVHARGGGGGHRAPVCSGAEAVRGGRRRAAGRAAQCGGRGLRGGLGAGGLGSWEAACAGRLLHRAAPAAGCMQGGWSPVAGGVPSRGLLVSRPPSRRFVTLLF